MNYKDYSIVYSSNTGNTKRLAEALAAYLPQDGCRYVGAPSAEGADAEMLYVGFWTDKGTADEGALGFLKNLKGKRIFLFGTAGFGESEDYYKQILARITEALDASNEVVGNFMCQGKMPMSVRARYEALKKEGKMPNADAMIANFDKALSHPDEADLAAFLQVVDAM